MKESPEDALSPLSAESSRSQPGLSSHPESGKEIKSSKDPQEAVPSPQSPKPAVPKSLKPTVSDEAEWVYYSNSDFQLQDLGASESESAPDPSPSDNAQFSSQKDVDNYAEPHHRIVCHQKRISLM